MQDYCSRGESELHTTQYRQAVYSPGAARGCQRVENDIRVQGFLQKAGQGEWTSTVGTGNLIHYQGEGGFPLTDLVGVLMPLDSACWGQDPRTGPSGQGGSKSLSECGGEESVVTTMSAFPAFALPPSPGPVAPRPKWVLLCTRGDIYPVPIMCPSLCWLLAHRTALGRDDCDHPSAQRDEEPA